jgi:Tol biopolymer transport system component
VLSAFVKRALPDLLAWRSRRKRLLPAVARPIKQNVGIYLIASDGAGPETRLTDVAAVDDGPEYTGDGKYIYFNSPPRPTAALSSDVTTHASTNIGPPLTYPDPAP